MTPLSSARRAVLLIEDDRADALLVRSLLEAEYDLVWVTDLDSAAPHLASGPDCVLLDLGLPDARSVEALDKVVELAPDAAVVVFTGLDDEARGLESIGRGAQDYVVKGSADGPMLGRSIRYATERKRAVNTARRLHEAELRAQENLRIERGLLPRPLLLGDSVRCMTLYRPGGDQALLGGDFFDVVELEDGSIRAMVGDVAGHGPDEAALGVRLRVAWRTLVLAGANAPEIFGTLQDLLVSERPSAEAFVTICDGAIDSGREAVTFCLAGHPAPVLVNGGEVQAAPALTGPPLGVVEHGDWRTTRLSLASRWTLLLYTDGLIENVGQDSNDRRRLGTDGLVRVIAESVRRGDNIQRVVQETLVALQDTPPGFITDDVAIVAISPLEKP